MTNQETQPIQSGELTKKRRNQGRLVLVIMFSVVFGMYFVANFLYKSARNQDLSQLGTTNKGTLIYPPAQLKEDLLIQHWDAKWNLFIIYDQECDQQCEDALYKSRQVRIALGKEAGRIVCHVVSISDSIDGRTDALLNKEYPNFKKTFLTEPESISKLFKVTQALQKEAISYIFLADPNGNIMMYFTPENSGKDMITDLKKLLKLSNIG